MGLEVVARSGSERLRDCIDLVIADLEPGDRVVLQRDGGPPPSEAQRLRAHAAEVVEVPIYTWQAALDDPRPAERLAEGVRSEERRVGNECVSTCRSTWSPYHKQKHEHHVPASTR